MFDHLNHLVMSVWLTLTGARPAATSRRGAGMLEYALLGLVALALFALIYTLSGDRGPIRGILDRISGVLG